MSGDTTKLVRVHPEKALEFPLVLYSSVTCPLVLENLTSSTVAFKIKTTAPRGYLVRPSSGLIQAGQTKEIQVILQPLQSVEQASPSHRFLIQTTICDSNIEQITKEFWQELTREQLFEHRLSVIFKQENVGAVGESISGVGNSSAQGGQGQLFSGNVSSTSQGPSLDTDFKNKYDELVQYCLALEKQSNELKEEAISLRERLEKSESKLRSSQNNSVTQGFEFWHVIAVIVVAVVALKIINYF